MLCLLYRKAHIIQREHKPVWKHGTIVPKTTWVGALEGMQYYATVSAGSSDTQGLSSCIIPYSSSVRNNFKNYKDTLVVYPLLLLVK